MISVKYIPMQYDNAIIIRFERFAQINYINK